jgi:phage shock protein A
MSIQLNQRVQQLEQRLAEINRQIEAMLAAKQQETAPEPKRLPGRPRKNE